MNIWKHIEELARQAEQGIWLALEMDGDSTTVVFLGDPFAREVVFLDGKYVAFNDEHRARGLRPTVRIAINVAIVDTGDVLVFERGVLFFKELAAMRERFPLDRWSFEIERNGAAGSLKTTYRVVQEKALGADERRAYAQLPRYDLARLAAGEFHASVRATQSEARASATISARDADAIMDALGLLPRKATERLVNRFGVHWVRDIPAAKALDAIAFVDRLVRDAEVDASS